MELASERVERLRQKAHDETKRSRRAEFQEDDAGAEDRKDKPVSVFYVDLVKHTSNFHVETTRH